MRSLFLMLFCCCSTIAFAQGEAELLKKIKAMMDKVNDYKAEGKMRIDVSFINAPESKVLVYYKKPDRFKIKKNGGISVLPKGGVSINVTGLLGEDNYTVVPAGASTVDGKAVKMVKLLPNEETSDIVLATVYLDETDLVIRRYTVTTRENGTYEMFLSYGKYTSYGLPDKVVFSFNTKDYKLQKGITFEYEKGEKKKENAALKPKKGKVEITYSSYEINKGVDDKVFTTD